MRRLSDIAFAAWLSALLLFLVGAIAYGQARLEDKCRAGDVVACIKLMR
jgi:hypothetical protein